MEPTNDVIVVVNIRTGLSSKRYLQVMEEAIIILLHGILVTGKSMEGTRRYLERETGLKAFSLTYSSRRKALKDLARDLVKEVQELAGSHPVFVVACSLGSIVLRHIMSQPIQASIKWSGCVLIAPPNTGSLVGRKVARVPLVGWLVNIVIGRAGVELCQETAEGRDWAAPPLPCGDIAGTKAVTLLNPVGWVSNFFLLFPRGEPNDGTVAVAETKLPPGLMQDFCTVHAGHTRIQNHPVVRRQILSFLTQGRFDPALTSSS